MPPRASHLLTSSQGSATSSVPDIPPAFFGTVNLVCMPQSNFSWRCGRAAGQLSSCKSMGLFLFAIIFCNRDLYNSYLTNGHFSASSPPATALAHRGSTTSSAIQLSTPRNNGIDAVVIYAQRATPYQIIGPCIGHINIHAHRRSQSSITGYYKVAKRNLFITESYCRAMCVYVGIYNPAQLSAVCVLTCSHPVALCHLFTVFLRCLLYVKMFCAQVPPFDSSVPIPPPTRPPARGLPRTYLALQHQCPFPCRPNSMPGPLNHKLRPCMQT